MKNPVDFNATITDAYYQIHSRYMRDIPHLLKYTVLSCISDGSNSRLGTTFSPYEHYYAWKKVRNDDKAADNSRELETLIEGAFAPERFLALLRDFVYFPDLKLGKEQEIVCRYPQFFATNKLLAYTKGFLKLAVDRDTVHVTICENAEFAAYNEKVTKAFENWKLFAEPKLTGLKNTDSNKKLIELYETVVLLDKYDVYQVLLAYWNETMNDDVLLIIQDENGYGVARETEDITEEIKSGKNKGKYKVVGWEGKLIPQKLVRDAFFSEETSAIAAKEKEAARKEADLDEFVENNSDDEGYLSEYTDDDKKIDSKEIVSRVRLLKKQKNKLDSDEYNVLIRYATYTDDIKNLNKEIYVLRKKLDKQCRERYSKFTEQEIKELLVHKKWYASLQDGIQNLYVTAVNNLSKRIVELSGRYENTLTELTQQEHDFEGKVAAHLKEMGFTYE